MENQADKARIAEAKGEETKKREDVKRKEGV